MDTGKKEYQKTTVQKTNQSARITKYLTTLNNKII